MTTKGFSCRGRSAFLIPRQARLEPTANVHDAAGPEVTLSSTLRRTFALLRELQRAVALDRMAADAAALRDYQTSRLICLVRHAATRVPLYREKYRAAGVDPSYIRSLDDLERLPLITRADLRAAFPDGLLAEGTPPDAAFLVETSGSTGVPVRVFKDWEALCAVAAWSSPFMLHRWWRTWGLRMMTLLLRQDHSMESAIVSALPRFLLHVRAGDALASPDVHLEEIQRFRPDVLVTYPTVLRTLAARILDRGVVVPQPRLLATSAEMLDGFSRKAIAQAFTGRLVNIYASTEAGFMAVECLEGAGLHVNGPRLIVEVLAGQRPAVPGEAGTVIVTDLSTMICPIIRYDGLGDVARWSTRACPCGRALPLLEVIEGRRADAFVLPDGRVLHPFALSHAMVHVGGVRRFQIVQEATDRVRVLIVPNGRGSSELTAQVNREFRALLGAGIAVDVDSVEEIPAPPGAHWPPTVRSLLRPS